MSHIDQLKLITAWNIEPTLTDDDLDGLLSRSAVEDTDGFAPANEAWTPTYDLNAAAAQAWLIKAARAAATVDEPTAGVVTSKIFDNCRAMARIYAAKRSAAVLAK